MTKIQAIKKYKMMKKDLHKGIDKEIERLLNSGGIDHKKFENNFRLPKILLSVALQNQVHQYSPLTKEDQKEQKNLSYF